MKVAIVVLQDCIVMPSISTMELLLKTNELHAQTVGRQEANPAFEVELVAVGSSPVLSAHGLPIRCHATVCTCDRADLVVVPALDGDLTTQLHANREVVPWLSQMYERGADIATICTGAFLVAETGLLDGKSATTHWVAQDAFRARYPRIHLEPQHVIVDTGRICTSGGATSFLNLVVYLIERYCGRETAFLAAKMFLIDVNKGSQNGYAVFSTQKAHGDREVLRAQDYIEQHVDRPLPVAELAHHVAASPRNFIRRFKSATGNTPNEYVQRVKVEAARKALETTNLSIGEVVRGVGYEDMASFRRLFARVTGMTPAEYRRRYTLHDAATVARAS